MLLSYIIATFVTMAESCMPTNPGTTPGPGTPGAPGPTEPICCPSMIGDQASTGQWVFDPNLSGCPATGNAVCSTLPEGDNTKSLSIVLNGATTIVTTQNGMNARALLICRFTDGTWLYNNAGSVIEVHKLACNQS